MEAYLVSAGLSVRDMKEDWMLLAVYVADLDVTTGYPFLLASQ